LSVDADSSAAFRCLYAVDPAISALKNSRVCARGQSAVGSTEIKQINSKQK
jgi:hypothetical protein